MRDKFVPANTGSLVSRIPLCILKLTRLRLAQSNLAGSHPF